MRAIIPRLKWILVACLLCTLNDVSAKPKGNQDDFSWAKKLFNENNTTSKTNAPKTYIDRNGRQVQCPACRCGIANGARPNSERIVQGVEAPAFQYPWLVWITFYSADKGIFVCGGSIINDLYVATASHCIKSIPANVTVSIFRHNLGSTKFSEDRGVEAIIMHERYNVAAQFDCDITLLKLDHRLDLSENHPYAFRLSPVCLPPRERDYTGEWSTAAGWGWVTPNAPISKTLQHVQLPVVDEVECRNIWGDKLTQNMICAGYSDSGRITCFGDSGGPLTYINPNTGSYELAGIVSWGWVKCGDPRRYGVFVKVTNFLDWIAQHTGDACYCN